MISLLFFYDANCSVLYAYNIAFKFSSVSANNAQKGL